MEKIDRSKVMSGLKPCPCCGGIELKYRRRNAIKCLNCGAKTPKMPGDFMSACSGWNSRDFDGSAPNVIMPAV